MSNFKKGKTVETAINIILEAVRKGQLKRLFSSKKAYSLSPKEIVDEFVRALTEAEDMIKGAVIAAEIVKACGQDSSAPQAVTQVIGLTGFNFKFICFVLRWRIIRGEGKCGSIHLS